MKLNGNLATATVLAGLMFVACSVLYAQSSTGSNRDESGFVLYESFEGSSNTLGEVTRLNSAIGYKFNRYFSVDAGIPVHFINASDSAIANGAQSGNGIGNVYVDLFLTLSNPVLTYQARLKGTAPTGNKDLGLTTGRATVDWNNYFGRDFGRLRPFANIGLANTVSDTPYFNRPFSTLGTVGHFEGGTSYGVVRLVRIGASLYDILPTGDQKVYSRLVRRSLTTAAGQGMPMITLFKAGLNGGSSAQQSGGSGTGQGMAGTGRMGFETQALTTGSSDLTRDNGYSAWLNISPVRHVFLQAGYTRSVIYRLDTFSFGVGFSFNLPGVK
jgi:hypothetical protein